MLEQHAIVQTRARHTLSVALAHDKTEIREAQRLRYKVFAKEKGMKATATAEKAAAKQTTPEKREPQHDKD